MKENTDACYLECKEFIYGTLSSFPWNFETEKTVCALRTRKHSNEGKERHEISTYFDSRKISELCAFVCAFQRGFFVKCDSIVKRLHANGAFLWLK